MASEEMPTGITITFNFPTGMTGDEAGVITAAMAALFTLHEGEPTWSFSIDGNALQAYKLGAVTAENIARALKLLKVIQ